MESNVIVVPGTPDPLPNPDPPPDHGVEIGRIQAENEELRRKIEEMQEHVGEVESTANFAADVATSVANSPIEDQELDEDSLREPALEELLASMYAGDQDEEEEAVVVDEPPPPPPAPPEKKKWWVI